MDDAQSPTPEPPETSPPPAPDGAATSGDPAGPSRAPATVSTVNRDDWLLRGYDGSEDGASIPPPPGAGGQLPPPIGLPAPDASQPQPPPAAATMASGPPVAPGVPPITPTTGGTPYHSLEVPPTAAPDQPPVQGPAFLRRQLGPTWHMLVASLIAMIYGVWYAIEGVVLASDDGVMANFYQQLRSSTPDWQITPDQMPILVVVLYGVMALLYTVSARFLLNFSQTSRMLLIVLGWVNIALFIRFSNQGADAMWPWWDNLVVGVLLVMLLASPDVRRRIRSKGVAVVRGPDPYAVAAMPAGDPSTTPAPTSQPQATGQPSTPATGGPYPLRLSVHLDPRPWGGGGLRRLGKPVPDGVPIGESWEVSGHPYAQSRIENGALAGRGLNEAVMLWGEWLLGPGNRPTAVRDGDRWDWRFPLLAKFLDTTAPLSVQVHPGDTDDGPGKAEAWVVLHAGDDAFVYQGFAADTTTGMVRNAIRTGTLPDLLRKVPVADGDVIYNPPGIVHAIGPNVRLYEIQQVCDTTYRLFDFARTDRELHVEQALGVMRLEAGVPELTTAGLSRARLGINGGEVDELLATPNFRTWQVVLPVSHGNGGNTTTRLGGDVVALVHHIAGSHAQVAFANHPVDFLRLGETMVIPASVLADGVRITPQDSSAGATTLLISTL